MAARALPSKATYGLRRMLTAFSLTNCFSDVVRVSASRARWRDRGQACRARVRRDGRQLLEEPQALRRRSRGSLRDHRRAAGPGITGDRGQKEGPRDRAVSTVLGRSPFEWPPVSEEV